LTNLNNTVYLYSMNDIYKYNKPSGQPMATRNLNSMTLKATIKDDDWLDRLITSMYIVLTGTLFSISLAVLLGLNS
jgi:ABC-type phosphate/phosphonate transport system permease subunit